MSHVADGLDPVDLRLHHKLVVLGGGKQAHVRGGDIHRLCIHSAALSAEQIQQVYHAIAQQNPALGGRVVRVQAIFRGFMRRELNRRAGLDVGQYCKKHGVVAQFSEGDEVECNWKRLGGWYKGRVSTVNTYEDGTSTYKIVYIDGDEEYDVRGDFIRAVKPPPAAAEEGSKKEGDEEAEDEEESDSSEEDEDEGEDEERDED